MLSIDTIARGTINVIRSAARPTAFDTGLLLVKDPDFLPEKRLRSYASSAEAAAGLAADGFPAETEAYKAAQKYFAAVPAPSRLFVSCYPVPDSPADALDTVLNIRQDFYGIVLADPYSDEVLISLASHVSGISKPAMLFYPLIGTPASVAEEGSLLRQLHDMGSRRVVATYAVAVSDAAAVMGTAMGLQTANTASAFALGRKSVAGLQPSDLNQPQVDAIQALGGNVYVTRGYSFTELENGCTPSCLRYDEVLYMDMIGTDLQNAALSLLVDHTGKLPQTDDTSAVFMNVFSSVLMRYTARGVLATGRWDKPDVGNIRNGDYVENGFALWADSYDNQSEADRAEHKAVPIQVMLVFAGNVESMVISVNVKL